MQLAEKMGIKERRASSLASILILMILLHTNICRATSDTKTNSSNTSCNGYQDDYLIGDMNLEEEFMMASETSRRMLSPGHGPRPLEPKLPAVSCPPYKPYKGCLPHPNGKGKGGEHCGMYKRTC